MYVGVVSVHRPAVPEPQDTCHPFIDNMDEITYWIYTKRAPCLMDYDKHIRKRTEEAHCSKHRVTSDHSASLEFPSPRKKKRIKLSLIDSMSIKEEHNVYFQTSKKQKRTVQSSCESDTLGSHVDFNIKKSSIQEKPKRSKLQCSRTTLHKKNKIFMSTPNAKSTALRRSLRQAQINNSNLNSSCDIYHSKVINGNYDNNIEEVNGTDEEECVNGRNHTGHRKKKVNVKLRDLLNGQLEDSSDVSGFTANYIRSTKVQSNKTPAKLTGKTSKNLVKEPKSSRKDSRVVVNINKRVNTGLLDTNILNCSTDSEQNVINFITVRNNNITGGVNRGTTVLKFIEPKNKSSIIKKSNPKFNITFKSSSTSRYPKRHKPPAEGIALTKSQNSSRVTKVTGDLNDSDRKENPGKRLSRNGRGSGVKVRKADKSVLVFGNSTEQASSVVSVNVATPRDRCRNKRVKIQGKTRQSEKKDSKRPNPYVSDSDNSEIIKKIFGA